jgi:hypothetical protein
MGATTGRREVASKTKMTTSTKRGKGRRRGHPQDVIAPSSFDATRAVTNACVAVVAVGNNDGVHRPPEVC